MPLDIEPKNDREIMLLMAQRMENFSQNIERIAGAIENLEKVKFDSLEKRISKLEKFMYQWVGAMIAVNFLIALYAAIKH